MLNMTKEEYSIPILSRKHVSTVLLFLLQRGTVKKGDIVDVVRSNTTVDKLIRELKEEDMINVSNEFAGRKTYRISLTPKGIRMAEQLKRAENIEKGIPEDPSLELTYEELEKAKNARFLFHVNVMDDHITVQENPPGEHSRVFNIYIKRNGNGEFRLWCEQDDSFDCWHVKSAWTYPHVQKMMMHYSGRTKICPVCGAENRERAKFCDQCGAKLE